MKFEENVLNLTTTVNRYHLGFNAGLLSVVVHQRR